MDQACIMGTGKYLPQTVLTSKDLEAFCDMSDAWIHQRTGIEERDFGLGHGAYGAWLKLFLIGRVFWSIMSVWSCWGLGFHRHRGFVSPMYWSF